MRVQRPRGRRALIVSRIGARHKSLALLSKMMYNYYGSPGRSPGKKDDGMLEIPGCLQPVSLPDAPRPRRFQHFSDDPKEVVRCFLRIKIGFLPAKIAEPSSCSRPGSKSSTRVED